MQYSAPDGQDCQVGGSSIILQRYYTLNFPMENPWLNLPSESSYILGIDRDSIGGYNKIAKNPEKVIAESIPEPFIGNPRSAKVGLLNLNPGHSDDDETAYRDSKFRKAMFCNLHHEPQQYSFYPLNPMFEWTACGKWWLRHTKKLIDGLDRACVAEKLLVIEWFPHHSKKAEFNGKLVCLAQITDLSPSLLEATS